MFFLGKNVFVENSMNENNSKNWNLGDYGARVHSGISIIVVYNTF